MKNYSSAQFELLALKLADTNELRDYLLVSNLWLWQTITLLAHVKNNKWGAAQIHLLSNLTLFNLDIKYHVELLVIGHTWMTKRKSSVNEEADEALNWQCVFY